MVAGTAERDATELNSEPERSPILGTVGISFEPDQRRSEMQGSHETLCKYDKASVEASVRLFSVDGMERLGPYASWKRPVS